MRRVALVFLILLFYVALNAQPFTIAFEQNKIPVEVLSKQPTSQKFRFNYPGISVLEINTDGGVYNQLAVPGTYRTGLIGEPQLVNSQKLISIPIGAEVTVKVNSYQKEEYQLDSYAPNHQIIPYQPSASKSEDSINQPFVVSAKAYKKNSFSKQPIATIEELGTLRGLRLAKLTINPVRYNPMSNQLVFYNHIEVEILYKNADFVSTQSQFETTYSPYFTSIYSNFLGTVSYPNNPDLVKQPIRYLIVAPDNYLNSLHDFIQWKKQKGFEVVIGNTNIIGNTSSQIKTWVQSQYADTLEGKTAPSFLMLVGDIEQVPASQIGTSTNRATDLYYASVDGDMFPDIYCGRLPARDTVQLVGMLNKILLYERYQFPDDSFLNDVTLIAGADATYNPRVAQPTVLYGTENYFNAIQGFSSVNSYLTTYTGCYNADKMAVSFVNYTAHCSQTTWANPLLSSSTVSTYTNYGKYPLVIGNCCQSGDFSINTSMGEAWIRNPSGGAIAYIGSVPDTYWYEDFYWAVGAHAPVANSYPSVAESSTGMFDAPFTSDYRTVDALLFTGNLAVTEAHNQGYTSDASSKYYWEAYHCLGDPSIIPYFKKGLVQTVTHLPKLESGLGEFMVEALPGSQATLSTKTQMLATILIPGEGKASLYFDSSLETDSVKLVVTKPNYKPYLIDIPVSVTKSSFLALKTFSFSDEAGNQNTQADFNETLKLSMELENIGDSLSQNVLISIASSDPFIKSVTSSIYSNLGSLFSGEIKSVTNFFELQISDSVPDQHIVIVTVQTSDSVPGKSRKYYTYQRQIVLNAPDLQILSTLRLDDFTGNGNERLDRGESAILTVGFVNTGHAQVSATAVLQSLLNEPSILITNPGVYFETINPGDTLFHSYSVTMDTNSLLLSDTLQFSLIGATYQKADEFILPIGMESPRVLGTEAAQLIDYPFNNYYRNNRTQLLYTKEEISQGISQISALGFNFSTITANTIYRDLNNFKIRMITTEAKELTAFIDMSSAQLVFSQSVFYLPDTLGWQTIELQQPFSITKPSNVVIEISWGTTDNYAPIDVRTKVFGSTTLVNSVAFGYDDYSNPPLLDGVSKNRPNIQLIFSELSIVTIDVSEKQSLSFGIPIVGCNLSIGNELLQTDESGRAKYISNPLNENLSINASVYGYRDTSFTWLKSELYSHLALELERNPKLVVEVKNNWGLPVSGANFIINGFSFISNAQGLLECFAAKKGSWTPFEIFKEGFHIYTDSVNPLGLIDTLQVVLGNDFADVTFKVTNTKLQPVSGATVSIDGEVFFTDLSGTAICSDFTPGIHTFRIESIGFSELSDTFSLAGSDTIISKTLKTLGSLQFTVTDGFLPLKEVSIFVAGFEEVTDTLGKVNFETMLEATYEWKANKIGYFESAGTFTSYGNETQIAIILKPIPDITFYVYNGFIAINDAVINVNNTSYLSDVNGLLKMVDVDTGAYSYSISKYSYKPISDSFIMGSSDTIIMVKLQPIPDLKVVVYSSESKVEGALVALNTDSLITNSMGEVLFPDLGAGNYSITISCNGYQSKTIEVELSNTDTVVRVDLLKLAEITWQVTSGSQPLDSVIISFNGAEYTTDIFGKSVLSGVENGEYAYQLFKSGYVEVDSTVIVNGNDQLLIHSMEKLTEFQLLVLDESSLPIPNVFVTLELGDFTTDANGVVNFNGVPKGLYHYELSKEGFFPVNDSIQVNTEKVTEIALMLRVTYRVQFTVVDSENNPLQEAQIAFNGEIKNTDSLGIASWNGLLPNLTYNYSVQKAGFVLKTGTVSITTANLYENIVLQTESYDVTFRVSDEFGFLESANITFDNKVKSTGTTGEATFYNILPADSMNYVVRKTTTHLADTGYISISSDTLITVNLITIAVSDKPDFELSIFPNPTTGKMLLTGNQLVKGSVYQIFNSIGTIVAQGFIDSSPQTVDLSEQNQGLYYIYVKLHNSYQVIKIVRD